MKDEVSNKYVSEALHDLINLFGVKKQLTAKDFCKPFGRGGDVQKCIEQVAAQLGLPVKINVSYIPSAYDPAAKANFNSRHVVNTDPAGSGTQGIIAEVAIPNSLPMHGSQSLRGFPINVRIKEQCTSSSATFITVMAHELSHVVLYSLRHPKKDNEFCTDLTAMLLGFAKIMKEGRKEEERWVEHGMLSRTHHTRTTRYGYPSDSNFDFALP
jgi:hypothetical protein